MIEDVRKYLEAAFESLNPGRARGVASRITELVQTEVKRQLKAVGIATREDLNSLRARVRELERSGGAPGRRSAKKLTAKRSTAKKLTAKRSTAKRSTAKRSTAGTSSPKGPESPSTPPSNDSPGSSG